MGSMGGAGPRRGAGADNAAVAAGVLRLLVGKERCRAGVGACCWVEQEGKGAEGGVAGVRWMFAGGGRGGRGMEGCAGTSAALLASAGVCGGEPAGWRTLSRAGPCVRGAPNPGGGGDSMVPLGWSSLGVGGGWSAGGCLLSSPGGGANSRVLAGREWRGKAGWRARAAIGRGTPRSAVEAAFAARRTVGSGNRGSMAVGGGQ